MEKSAVIIKVNEKPIVVAQVVRYEILDLMKAQQEAGENFNEFLKGYEDRIKTLEEKVSSLEKEVKYLKGE